MKDKTSINLLLKSLNLKDEKRTGWELRGIEDPEKVAAHSWGVSLLTLIYGSEEDLKKDKAVKMSIIHDLAEAEVGDIPKRAIDVQKEISASEKEELEEKAMEKFSKGLGEELNDLWNEYENRETLEAKFVKDMDLIDMCLTALKYEKEKRYDPSEDNPNFVTYKNLDEFFITSQNRLNTETGKKLFTEIKTRYEETRQ